MNSKTLHAEIDQRRQSEDFVGWDEAVLTIQAANAAPHNKNLLRDFWVAHVIQQAMDDFDKWFSIASGPEPLVTRANDSDKPWLHERQTQAMFMDENHMYDYATAHGHRIYMGLSMASDRGITFGLCDRCDFGPEEAQKPLGLLDISRGTVIVRFALCAECVDDLTKQFGELYLIHPEG